MAGSFFDTFVFYFPKRLIIIYLAGFLNLVFAGFFVIKFVSNKSKTSKEVFIFILYLFILGSIAATTISRIGYGVETLIGSKYKIYSFILLFLNFYSILVRNNKLAFPILIFSVIINLTSYIFENQNLIFQKNERIAEYMNSIENKEIDLMKLSILLKVNPASWKSDSSNMITNQKEFVDLYKLNLNGTIFNDFSLFCLTNSSKTIYFPIDLRYSSLRNFIGNSKKEQVTIEKNTIQTDTFKTSIINFKTLYSGEKLHLKGITRQKIKQNW